MKTILIFLASISSNFHVELDAKQTHCIAHAVYHEARNQEIMGQAAVAYVVNNRVHSKRYPNTACKVVYQPWQFSYIKTTKPNYESKAWKTAVEIATYSQVGLIDDETNGATMYFAHDLVTPRWNWSKLELVGVLDGHTFLREI